MQMTSLRSTLESSFLKSIFPFLLKVSWPHVRHIYSHIDRVIFLTFHNGVKKFIKKLIMIDEDMKPVKSEREIIFENR